MGRLYYHSLIDKIRSELAFVAFLQKHGNVSARTASNLRLTHPAVLSRLILKISPMSLVLSISICRIILCLELSVFALITSCSSGISRRIFVKKMRFRRNSQIFIWKKCRKRACSIKVFFVLISFNRLIGHKEISFNSFLIRFSTSKKGYNFTCESKMFLC